MLSKTFFSYFSDSDIIRKCIIFNEASKGVTLTYAYDAYTRSCIAHQKILCHNSFLQDYCMNFFHHYEASELRLTIVDQRQVRSAGCIKTQPQN